MVYSKENNWDYWYDVSVHSWRACHYDARHEEVIGTMVACGKDKIEHLIDEQNHPTN